MDMSLEKRKERSNIFVWALYDFANTSFSIIVVTFLYAVYFKKTVVSGDPLGDFYWSLSISLAMLVTAVIAPTLGAIADYTSQKKPFLLFFTLLCVLFTSLLFLVGPGDIAIGILFFVLANIGFEAGLIFYDAFLPEITSPKNFGRVSGYGFAAGYVGSLASLGLVFPFIESQNYSSAFPVTALFFLLFSAPLFLFLHERKKKYDTSVSFIKVGVGRVFSTLKNLPGNKNLALFLLAFFFYIEGVNTVIFFAGNYASTTLGFTETDLILFFLAVQITAIIGSVGFGALADTTGQKPALMLTLILWIVTVTIAYTVESKEMFYVVGFLAGAAMGASQSTSRALMSKLVPFDKKTEFFGFFSFFGKSSAIIGPLTFGLISSITGSQRSAIISLVAFFVVGMLLLTRVKEPMADEVQSS